MKKDREEWLEGISTVEYGKARARNWEEEKGDGKRKTKDKVKNAEGRG
jgi:hypothetical protein